MKVTRFPRTACLPGVRPGVRHRRHPAGHPDFLPAPLDQAVLHPEVAGACSVLVNRRGDRRSAPEVRVDRPPGPSIGVERKRDLYPATARAAHASPLLDAAVHDQPQLARWHGSFARMLRDRRNEQVVTQPPEPTQYARDKSLHGHPITPRNGLTSPRPQFAWLAHNGQVATGRQVMARSSTRSKRRILLCVMPAGPRKLVSP